MEDRMPKSTWEAVDRYLNETLVSPDPILDAAVAANATAGLPAIDVTATQGQFLHLLARLVNAKRILEIGTLGGYSTIWLARALARGGKLITLEYEPKHAEVALKNIANAGLSHLVELRQGPAARSLDQLHAEREHDATIPPFDLIFIDADKRNNAVYLDWSLKLSHPGTLIVVDNVIRDGKITEAKTEDSNIQGTRRMFEKLGELSQGRSPRLAPAALQTVGSKGYDGFALALVLA
jgi:predicted O-methyltransferase YrrM